MLPEIKIFDLLKNMCKFNKKKSITQQQSKINW